MIYTLTLNPSIDYVIYPKNDLALGELNRFDKNFKYAGGKGINVSRILKELGTNSVATGYIGGFTGDFIVSKLNKEGISNQFIKIDEDSRINVKIKGETETEINGAGPYISDEKQSELVEQFEQLKADDTVILSGSKALGLPIDFYQKLILLIQEQNASFVIDTTGDELLNALSARPLLIKPNQQELEHIYSTDLAHDHDYVRCGKDLLSKGAEHVIISRGKDGAFLVTKQGAFHGQAALGILVNSVGAGDAMVAGFVGKYKETNDSIKAFEYSLACGTATAFKEDLATIEDIEQVLQTVSVIKLLD